MAKVGNCITKHFSARESSAADLVAEFLRIVQSHLGIVQVHEVMQMVKDSLVFTGVLIGLLADVIKLGVNYLGYLLGYTDVVFWQLVATLILPRQYLLTTSATVIGAAIDVTVSSLLGVSFLFLIMYTGIDFLFLKGIGFGLLAWVGPFSILLGRLIETKLPQNSSGVIVTLFAHIAFGVALAVFTSFLYQPQGKD